MRKVTIWQSSETVFFMIYRIVVGIFMLSLGCYSLLPVQFSGAHEAYEIIIAQIYGWTVCGGSAIAAIVYTLLYVDRITLTEETIVERNLLRQIKKQHMLSSLVAIHKYKFKAPVEYRVYLVESGKYFCLHFCNNIVYGRDWRIAQKDTEVILISANKHNAKILKKYLPEKWHAFLDQPVEK